MICEVIINYGRVCVCVCVQAIFWCTTSRAKKVAVSLTLAALVVVAVDLVCMSHADTNAIHVVSYTLLRVIVPVAVLVINVVVVVQVRRAASNAAANLGVQPHHHQSTSNNSAVPTVMLIATSIIYVLLYSTANILMVLLYCLDFSSELRNVVGIGTFVAATLVKLIFAYNFYVYLITGKLFRSELHKLRPTCCCFS